MRAVTMPPHVFSARFERGRHEISGPPHLEAGHRLDGRGIFVGWTWDGERLTIDRDRFRPMGRDRGSRAGMMLHRCWIRLSRLTGPIDGVVSMKRRPASGDSPAITASL